MPLPKITLDRIEADAAMATNKQDERLRNKSNDYGRRISFLDGYEDGYIAGATAEAERAQPLADLLELIKTFGPVDSLTVKLIDKKLKEWKG